MHKKLFSVFIFCIPIFLLAQDICEPVYTVPKIMHVNNVGSDGSASGVRMVETSTGKSISVIAGQPFAGNLIGNVYSNDSTSLGFYSYYLREPIPPTMFASDGDYESKILVTWELNDGTTGPPITSSETKLYRNGFVLTTVNADVTEYQDFNVFAGVTYEYEAIVSNARGDSHDGEDYGFLNPNGMITGLVETPNGNPVQFTQVIVTPNLGLSAKFNGDGYIFWYDSDINGNRQFSGFEEDYTIETWFRSVNTGDMTLFSAVDSATTDHYVDITLNSEGKISWVHTPPGEDPTTLTSTNAVAGAGEIFHHLALVYENGNMTMFIDGYIITTATNISPIGDKVELMMGKKSPREHINYYSGYLDDFRIWSEARDWEDIRGYRNITLSGEENNLAAYWKFDESAGDAVFDLSEDENGNPKDNDGEVCLVDRSDIIANVFVGGLTDSLGRYSVKNIGYGTGTTFTVTPSKETIIGRSIEFDGVDDYIDFSSRRIDLSNGFTLESWFKTPGSSSDMTLFSSRNPIDDSLEVVVSMNANEPTISVDYFEQTIATYGEVNDNLWHHWAVVVDTVNNTIVVYVDGDQELGSNAVLAIDESLTRDITVVSEFRMGSGLSSTSHNFLGFIDETRLWGGPRTLDQVTGTMNQLLDGDETGLLNYWNFNDGSGTALNDVGSGLATGILMGMETGSESWSIDIPLEESYEHYYSPESRFTTLNHSNTSVDLVDFTDESLLPVSGYVMYEGTNCFIEGAEVLVNDASLFPKIYSDETGKYIVEIEPGIAGDLISIDYEEHEFDPSFIELPTMTRPLSGQYFYDKELRSLNGIVAGGSCQFPLPLNEGEEISVTLTAVDNCIEKIVVPDSLGNWSIDSLPPIIYNISAYHPNPDITFDADTISLVDRNRTKEFIYYAPLEVIFVDGSTSIMDDDDGLSGVNLSDFPDFVDADAVVQQPFQYSVDFFVFEEYDGDSCQVDTFYFSSFDDISGQTIEDTVQNEPGTELDYYKFQAYETNLLTGETHSYQNKIQLVIEDKKGRTASANYYAVVLGNQSIDGNRFVLNGSSEPWYVLRVPPGDESYSFLTTENEICNTVSTTVSQDNGVEVDVEVMLGITERTIVGLGVAKEVAIEIEHTLNPTLAITETKESNTEKTSCLVCSQTYVAYGDDEVMGNDATVFIGGSKTYDYGLARSLQIDQSSNSIVIDTVLTEDGSEIASTYIHSRYYIENVLMPDLLILVENSEDADEAADAQDEYDFFADLMQKDLDAVANAVEATDMTFGDEESVTTITWDAGIEYEYIASSSQTTSNTFETTLQIDETFSISTGGLFNGFGVLTSVTQYFSQGNTESETEEQTTTTESGFFLSDNDPGDGYSMTVKADNCWNMPVYELNGGQSSCPWIEGTLRRQVADIAVEENLLVDMPPEEPAVFTVLLGNNSDTGEDGNYYLTVDNASNPYGLTLTASGDNLADGVNYSLAFGEQLEVSVSIDRGPEYYEYNNIVLQLVPDCEFDEFDEDNWINYDEVEVSVHYKEPCSESEISFPEDGWLVDAAHLDGDTLLVTIGEYDLTNTVFQSINLQYRKDGIGDWFIAEEFDKDHLDTLVSNYVVTNWNIDPSIITDGEYELRSVATCSGDDYDGVSQIVSGLIDRTGPQELTTTPADGILGADDQISITFNETVDCDEILLGAGDITFVDTETGIDLDFTITCGDNIIIIEPALADRFLENTTLNVNVNRMLDVYGNDLDEPIDWEFYFNKNPVAWSGSDISNVILYVDEEYSTTRTLVNSGGSNNSYYIFGGRDISQTAEIYPNNTIDLPSWISISPSEGTLSPDSEQDITIGLVEDLNFGEYETTIYAGVNGVGDEELNVYIRKLCYEPDWTLNPSDFQYSMNITANLVTQPSAVVVDTSDDVYDMVGVFVGEELRGVAHVEYLEELSEISNFHPYEVFLTVFSDTTSGEDLSFKVWDASECAVLGTIIEEYEFVNQEVLGSITNPVLLTATSQIVSEIEYPSGWSWLSFNTFSDDMSVNTILNGLDLNDGDVIKNSEDFASYGANGWVFSNPFDIDPQKMYKLRISASDTLENIGYAVDVELDTIIILEGWNWIGYTPQESYEINEALESLNNTLTSDLIKSQEAYAQYLENYGWFGSLSYMNPKKGYQFKSSSEDTLLYPYTIAGSLLANTNEEDSSLVRSNSSNRDNPIWEIDASLFSSSMSLTTRLITLDSSTVNTNDVLAAFDSEGQIRGVGYPQYIEPIDEFLVFLTIYGNQAANQSITFQVYHEDTDQILIVPQAVLYEENAIIGTILDPFTIDARTLQVGDDGFIPLVYSLSQNFPNPFNPVTKIGYGLPKITDVQINIYNLKGETVATIVNEKGKDAGFHFALWNSSNSFGNPVAAGVYIYQIRAGDFIKSRKLILLK